MNTKSTFQAVASIIASAKADETPSNSPDHDSTWIAACEATRINIAFDMSRLFAAENPRFDQKRFLQACNIDLACQ